MKNRKNVVKYEFTYLYKHLDMIKSKTKNKCKLSIYNGFINKIYYIERDENDTIVYYNFIDDILEEITIEDLIKEIINLYLFSLGKITIIYRIFTNKFNFKTNGEFRELWGDVLYIDVDTLKLTSENINADNLSNIVSGLELTEEEIKEFGRIEEYVFKDDNDNTILGLDLI